MWPFHFFLITIHPLIFHRGALKIFKVFNLILEFFFFAQLSHFEPKLELNYMFFYGVRLN